MNSPAWQALCTGLLLCGLSSAFPQYGGGNPGPDVSQQQVHQHSCLESYDCVAYPKCVNGVISGTTGYTLNLRTGIKSPSLPADNQYPVCGEYNVCCLKPDQTHSPNTHGGDSSGGPPYPTCSDGLYCVHVSECNLYTGFLEPQVQSFPEQQFVQYSLCTSDSLAEGVCCQDVPIEVDHVGTPSDHSTGQRDVNNGFITDCGYGSECTPYFQCNDYGVISTDGIDLINIRIDDTDVAPKIIIERPCKHYDHGGAKAICCKIPEDHLPITDVCPQGTYCDKRVSCDQTGGYSNQHTIDPKCHLDKSLGQTGVCCAPPPLATCTQPQVCIEQRLCSSSTDGAGQIDIRRPHVCSNPVHPNTPSVCCIPILTSCEGGTYCTSKSSCDYANGYAGPYQITHSFIDRQCYLNPGSHEAVGVCCAPHNPIDYCPIPGQICVEQQWCNNLGTKNIDGSGSYNINHPNACTRPEYPTIPGVCCNPLPVTCSGGTVCSNKGTCGYDGGYLGPYTVENSLINKRCYWDEATGELGVCCGPPPPVDVCPHGNICLKHNDCNGYGTASISIIDHIDNNCYLPSGDVGICCASCHVDSLCIPEDFCFGLFLDQSSNYIAHSNTGLAQCDLTGLGTISGVCCKNPPVAPPAANQCGYRNYEYPTNGLNARISGYAPATTEAKFGEFPWQVLIAYRNFTYICGGSLVHESFIVTAAHCVNNIPVGDIVIRTGEWDVSNFEEAQKHNDHYVAHIKIHEHFNHKNVHNDIAVIQLKSPVTKQYHINTVCLPPYGTVFDDYTRCFATGWGKDAFEGNYQAIMKLVELPVVSNPRCEGLLRKTRLGKYFKLDNSFMCAGGELGSDSCKGDGGGPLVCKDSHGHYVLAGITAWGIGCGGLDIPGVYVDVQQFSNWVTDIINYKEPQVQQVSGPPAGTDDINTCGTNEVCVKHCSSTPGSSILGKECYSDKLAGKFGTCCFTNIPTLHHATPKCGLRNEEYTLDLNTRIQSDLATNEAKFGEFPWQALIFSNLTFKCGATLIDAQFLVTAAHCVYGSDPKSLTVRLGEWQVNNYDEPKAHVDKNVETFTIHKDYVAKPAFSDIAVIQLVSPVAFDYHIQPICLPNTNYVVPDNTQCIATGWGKDSFTGSYQHIQKKIHLPLVGDSKCQHLLRATLLGKHFQLDETFICAGGELNEDACEGDGGGPLACQRDDGSYVLTGVTAWGIECGKKDVPGVYVETSHFVDWITNLVDGHYNIENQSGNTSGGYGRK